LSFAFQFPEDWTLTEDLKDIGRSTLEGDIVVTSPNGTKVHFGPNLGGKGGACLGPLRLPGANVWSIGSASVERDDDLAVGAALLDVRQCLEGVVKRERLVDDRAEMAGVVEGGQLA
jgi:hypothetical protein